MPWVLKRFSLTSQLSGNRYFLSGPYLITHLEIFKALQLISSYKWTLQYY